MYTITGNDLTLTLQHRMIIKIKLEVYTLDGKYVNELMGGFVEGSSTIDAESDVRRTCSLTFIPSVQSRATIEEEGYFWIDKNVRLSLGIEDTRNGDITWYKQGTYIFTQASMTYDATTNQIQLSCSDYMATLDGTRNGQLGQQIIEVPAYTEDEVTGEVIKYNTIREAMIYTVSQLGRINNYKVDDIGEFLGMPQYNPDYIQYREQSKVPVKDGTLTPIWNTVPYDLEFSSGCSVLDIINELRDLYPNYECYMDIDNNFCCNMIPSCYEDDIMLNNSYMQKIIISENTTVDFTQVKNVVEIWGSSIETDYFNDEGVTLSGDTYVWSNEAMKEKYYNGDKVGARIPSTNPANSKININGFGAIDIYDENTDKPLSANVLEANEIYVFKIKSKYVNRTNIFRAYLLGRYQVHAMAALVSRPDGNPDDLVTFEGKTFPRYSEEYFKVIHNCEYVYLDVIPDSPFTCQKLGVILSVKSGEEFENIESSSVGVANAKYQLWKSARLPDSITLETKLCPFMDVNQKIEYKPAIYDNDEPHQYIVKNITHNWDSGTTSWTLMRFYPLYQDPYPTG